jgi:hypothetical protein
LGLVGARHLWLQLLVESASRPLGLPILLIAAPYRAASGNNGSPRRPQ